MESHINVTVSILQDELRIDEVLEFIWVPNKCKQMEVESEMEWVVQTFDEDIQIVYKLAEENSCLNSSFYNLFKVANATY